MNFTNEQLEKAKAAKSAEELIALAKENGMELSEEEVKKYFAELHKEGELADAELNNVAGGCGEPDPKSNPVVDGGWKPCKNYSKSIDSYLNNSTDRCALCRYFHPYNSDHGCREKGGECYYRD